MSIIITLKTAPAIEPVSIEDLMDYIRIDDHDEEIFLDRLLKSAREKMEAITSRAFITQTWTYFLTEWPGEAFMELPRPPLQSVTSIKYTDYLGVQTTFTEAGNWGADTDSEPGQVILDYGIDWPSVTLRDRLPIEVEYVAGYGLLADNVPGPITQAIEELVHFWYDNRGGGLPVPSNIKNMVAHYRMMPV